MEFRSFDAYRMPDAMWEKIRPLLPDYETCLLGGRPRRDLRSVADAIIYRLGTGCQWKAIPKCLAPFGGSRLALAERRRRDDQSTSWWRIHPKKPTDRAKSGTKRSLLTEAAGIPTGLAVGGANVHDIRLLRTTLRDALMRSRGIHCGVKEHLCMDKGHDSAAVKNMVENVFDYIPHVRTRGEEKKVQSQQPTTCSTMGSGADSWLDESISSNSGAMGQKTEQQHRRFTPCVRLHHI